MQLIGILGGVASGKSRVAEMFRARGAVILDADRVGHDVLRLSDVKQTLVARWGPGILAVDGEIDRRAVAAIVFGNTPSAAAELAFLERVSHPRIGDRLRDQVAALRAAGQTPAAILDAPVMLKAGWQKLCDHLLFIDAPREIRLARAAQRGWTPEQFAAREAAQESVETKRAHCDATIDNSGELAATESQVDHLWREWIQHRPP